MMKRASTLWLALLGAIGIMVLCSFGAPPTEERAARATFLERLKPGQSVTLTDKDGRYEIGMFAESIGPLSHNVVEIGQDFVVLRDIANITDTIVPVYSIKAIRVLRVGGKQRSD
ncbi:MAG: hypothetical protein ABR915_20975 [Thermoguttaceae bacterium]|jgi:hypothetical protein